MEKIEWSDFLKLELRAGMIVAAEPFLKARRPAYKLKVDLGDEIGVKKSSAQIVDKYLPEELIGKQVLCVTNFPPKQIGPYLSEVLVTGFVLDQGTVLCNPDQEIPNGTRLL